MVNLVMPHMGYITNRVVLLIFDYFPILTTDVKDRQFRRRVQFLLLLYIYIL